MPARSAKLRLQPMLAVVCTLANGTTDNMCTVVVDDDKQVFHWISCHIVPWKDGFDFHRSLPLGWCSTYLVDEVWHWRFWCLPRSRIAYLISKQLVALCITLLATSLYQNWPEVEVSTYSDACYGVVAFTTCLLLGLGMQYSETAAD